MTQQSARKVRRLLGPMLVLSAAALIVHAQSGMLFRSPDAHIDDDELVELSGITPARTAGEFWGHNDSGHEPVLFRFNDRGQILQRVKLRGTRNRDWEAATTGPAGHLFVADIGDNFRHRRIYTLYEIAEPSAEVKSQHPLAGYRFSYPDEEARNGEALFCMNGQLYIISKEQSVNTPPLLFGINMDGSVPRSNKKQTLDTRLIGTLKLHAVVTDAAYSDKLKQLAVLSYEGVYYFRATNERELLGEPHSHFAGFFGIAEALCYDGNEVVVTNEAGMLWRLPAPPAEE